jgi:hypothetical protein
MCVCVYIYIYIYIYKLPSTTGYWRKDKRGIEMRGRRGRRRRKLLDDLKERRGYSHLEEEALDRTMWKVRLGRGFGSVVRQTTKRIYIYIYTYNMEIVLLLAWHLHALMFTKRREVCCIRDVNSFWYCKFYNSVYSVWYSLAQGFAYFKIYNTQYLVHIWTDNGTRPTAKLYPCHLLSKLLPVNGSSRPNI